MFSPSDTIVGIATPPGRGGIGVVRLSGAGALHVAGQLVGRAEALRPRYATLTTVRTKPAHAAAATSGVRSRSGRSDFAIDRVIAIYFPGPASYTGDDVVEISAHGSPVVLRDIVAAAVAAGARLAEPGEFTLRAFLNGRIDLPQAEAIGDLVDAVTPLQARAAFDQLQGTLTEKIGAIDVALFDLTARLEASIDFPEEGYHFVDGAAVASELDGLIDRADRLMAEGARGRIVREGLVVAVVGKPNVGKSSLFNALVGSSRAIVTEAPGTTRDVVSEVVDFSGLRMTLVDTAGLRETTDIVEGEGIRRARAARTTADLVLVVLDRATPLDDDDARVLKETSGSTRVMVGNKSDLPCAWRAGEAIPVSAKTGDGLPELRRAILAAFDLDLDEPADRPGITNVRHLALVERAREALARAREGITGAAGRLSEEFVLADLQEARAAFEEICGKRVPEDLLAHIFASFCIGK